MTETPAWSHVEAATGTGAKRGCSSGGDGGRGTWGQSPKSLKSPWGMLRQGQCRGCGGIEVAGGDPKNAVTTPPPVGCRPPPLWGAGDKLVDGDDKKHRCHLGDFPEKGSCGVQAPSLTEGNPRVTHGGEECPQGSDGVVGGRGRGNASGPACAWGPRHPVTLSLAGVGAAGGRCGHPLGRDSLAGGAPPPPPNPPLGPPQIILPIPSLPNSAPKMPLPITRLPRRGSRKRGGGLWEAGAGHGCRAGNAPRATRPNTLGCPQGQRVPIPVPEGVSAPSKAPKDLWRPEGMRPPLQRYRGTCAP